MSLFMFLCLFLFVLDIFMFVMFKLRSDNLAIKENDDDDDTRHRQAALDVCRSKACCCPFYISRDFESPGPQSGPIRRVPDRGRVLGRT